MLLKEFETKLKNEKKLKVYEFEFTLLPDKKVIVIDTIKNVCDLEIYQSPKDAYFVYSYTLKQTTDNAKNNVRMRKIGYGVNDSRKLDYYLG